MELVDSLPTDFLDEKESIFWLWHDFLERLDMLCNLLHDWYRPVQTAYSLYSIFSECHILPDRTGQERVS